MAPGSVDGREAVVVFRDRDDAQPSYFIELEFEGEQLITIKDFRYVPYILADATRVEWVRQ